MMKIFIAGHINIETTVRVDEGFPFPYAPVRYPFFGVRSTVAGVGYNISKALVTLGNEVRFLSLIGDDAAGELVRGSLRADGIPETDVLATVSETAQSAILYDPQGRRQIFTDLKDIQQQTYPPDRAVAALAGCDLAICSNINYARSLLAPAQAAGIPVATDVHAIADLDDDYNRDYMAAADILFMSDEQLPCAPEEWALRVQERYGTAVIVIGLGAEGALLALRDAEAVQRVPAVHTRPVVNTVGAGDALFAAFTHHYARTGDPVAALETAVVFASYKIGSAGAADGFLPAAELQAWMEKLT